MHTPIGQRLHERELVALSDAAHSVVALGVARGHVNVTVSVDLRLGLHLSLATVLLLGLVSGLRLGFGLRLDLELGGTQSSSSLQQQVSAQEQMSATLGVGEVQQAGHLRSLGGSFEPVGNGHVQNDLGLSGHAGGCSWRRGIRHMTLRTSGVAQVERTAIRALITCAQRALN